MERQRLGGSQAPDGTIKETRRMLGVRRDEALLTLRAHVLMSLIATGGEELPHWRRTINHDGTIPQARTIASKLARGRKKIVREEILPRKAFLGLPAFEPVQHRRVRTSLKRYAKELGVSVGAVMTIVDRQMSEAVNLQKKSLKKSSQTKAA